MNNKGGVLDEDFMDEMAGDVMNGQDENNDVMDEMLEDFIREQQWDDIRYKTHQGHYQGQYSHNQLMCDILVPFRFFVTNV